MASNLYWVPPFIGTCPIVRNQYETGIYHTRGSLYRESKKAISIALPSKSAGSFFRLLFFLCIAFIFSLFLLFSLTRMPHSVFTASAFHYRIPYILQRQQEDKLPPWNLVVAIS